MTDMFYKNYKTLDEYTFIVQKVLEDKVECSMLFDDIKVKVHVPLTAFKSEPKFGNMLVLTGYPTGWSQS